MRAAAGLNMVFLEKKGNILGMNLCEEDNNTIYIFYIIVIFFSLGTFFSHADINFSASLVQYEVLDTLEFTSDRKRMSLVVRDCQNGNIILLSKGADEAILPHAHAGYNSLPSSTVFHKLTEEKSESL